MQNISYFCIVKVFIQFLRFYLLTLLFTIHPYIVKAQEGIYDSSDDVTISLLTCQPYHDVYSLYGHTAIRYQNKTRNIDVAINYGMFSFQKSFFILRFVFGLTDYEMAIEPFDAFRTQYAAEGRGVYEQILNLTPREKGRIIQAIDENYKPENRVYRYNYFYDNCTTRARDIIVNNMDSRVAYSDTISYRQNTYRTLIHLCTENYPWARFGNDLLLGIKADFPITKMQQQFLPQNLMKDFSTATRSTLPIMPLVSDSRWVVEPRGLYVPKGFPLSPLETFSILAALTLTVLLFEVKRKTRWRYYDFITMLVTGLAGIIIFMMIFSQHPTVNLNLQILFLNPLTFIYSYTAINRSSQQLLAKYYRIWAILICLFIMGGFFQHYAEGITIFALSLLVRLVYHIFKKQEFK